MSYEGKVISHGFTRFRILYLIQIRMFHNKLIAKYIINYLILVSIKQVFTEI